LNEWIVLLKDVGFPIALSVVLLRFGFKYVDNDRTERRLEREQFLAALEKNTGVVERLADEIRLLHYKAKVNNEGS